MRTINPHPHLLNHPVRLTEEEKQNPHLVLQDFFSCFHLHDTREILWEWLSAALGTESGEYNTGYSRSNLLFVYEKLELLIEAAYQVNKRNQVSTFGTIYHKALQSQLKKMGSRLMALRIARREQITSVAAAINLRPDILERIENGEHDIRIKTLLALLPHSVIVQPDSPQW